VLHHDRVGLLFLCGGSSSRTCTLAAQKESDKKVKMTSIKWAKATKNRSNMLRFTKAKREKQPKAGEKRTLGILSRHRQKLLE